MKKKIRSISISEKIDGKLQDDSNYRGLTISANVTRILYDYFEDQKTLSINGKKLKVENVDLNGINDKMKSGGIKRIFAKSMKNRLQSRTLLNKFIEEVA